MHVFYAPKQENCFRSDGVLLSLVLDVLNRQVGDLSQLLELEKESADIRSHAVNGPISLVWRKLEVRHACSHVTHESMG